MIRAAGAARCIAPLSRMYMLLMYRCLEGYGKRKKKKTEIVGKERRDGETRAYICREAFGCH